MLDPQEAQLLGEIHAYTKQLLANDADKENRIKCLESSHNRLKGIIIATNTIGGAAWATLVLCFPSLASLFSHK